MFHVTIANSPQRVRVVLERLGRLQYDRPCDRRSGQSRSRPGGATPFSQQNVCESAHAPQHLCAPSLRESFYALQPVCIPALCALNAGHRKGSSALETYATAEIEVASIHNIEAGRSTSQRKPAMNVSDVSTTKPESSGGLRQFVSNK